MPRPGLRTLGISFSFLVGPHLCAAQSPVAAIDREAAVLQGHLSSLKRDSVDLPGYSAEGGLAIIYRDSAGPVRLIHVHFFGEGGQAIQDFYFRGGALMLCQEELQTYNVPFTMDSRRAKELGTEPFDPKKTEVAHNRYYFRDGQMIRWQKNRRQIVRPQAVEFRDAAEELMTFADTLLVRFR